MRIRKLRRLKRLASHPRFLVATLVLGMLLGLSALGVGFFTDDYPFIAHLEESGPQRGSPWTLYEFASGDEHANFELMNGGPTPGGRPPSEAPLSASALERALRSRSRVVWTPPVRLPPAHLFSVRRVALRGGAAFALRARAAALGHEHARLCAGPIACRAAGVDFEPTFAISTAPALLGLAAHVHRREHREGRLARLAWGGWLAPAGLVLGLLGGEAAISVAVYWLAYEAWGAPEAGERRARLRNLAVPLVIVVAYLLTYKALGYGVRHSEAYVDAMESPVTFASTVFWRLPLLLGEVLLGVPAALAYNVFPKIGALVGLLGGLLVAVLLRTVWSELSLSSRRAVRWLVCGAFLSMLIGLGGIPGARLVVIPGIGASVVLGAILTHGWRRWATSRWPARSAGRAGVALLVVIHLALAPLTFLASVQSIATLGKKTAEIDASLDGLLNERHAVGQRPATSHRSHRVRPFGRYLRGGLANDANSGESRRVDLVVDGASDPHHRAHIRRYAGDRDRPEHDARVLRNGVPRERRWLSRCAIAFPSTTS